MIDWINANSGLLTLLFSCVVSCSTAVYAVLTARLVNETKRLRLAETEPHVGLYVRPGGDWVNILECAVENHGRAPAFDLRLEVTPGVDGMKAAGFETEFLKIVNGLPALAPGERFSGNIGSAIGVLATEPAPRFVARLAYSSLDQRRFESSYVIDVEQYRGLVRGSAPEFGIQRSLEKIETHVKKLLGLFERAERGRRRASGRPRGGEPRL